MSSRSIDVGRAVRTTRRRAVSVPAVLAAFVIGATVSAIAAPDHGSGQAATVGTIGSSLGDAGGDAPSEAFDSGGTIPSGPTSAGGAPSAGGGGAITPSSPSSGGSSTGTPSGPSGASGGAAGSTANGGATARGVTATEIKIGVIDLDSSDLAPVCPRCGNGPSRNGGAELGLVAAARASGLLPLNGRDIKMTFQITRVTSPESNRNACVAMAQQVKPFAVIIGPGVDVAGACLAQEFKIPVIHAGGTANESFLRQVYPYWIEVGQTPNRLLRNYAHWADANGLLKGKKIGIYAPETDVGYEWAVDFKRELAKLGVTPAAEVRASGTQGLGSTAASDAVAVQRFRAAGVDVAFLLTAMLGFQTSAQAQAYRPAYPMVDTGYNFTDAVTDILMSPDATDGNLGYGPKFWSWSKRKPATARGNAAAQACIDAYSSYAKRTLDVFDNDAEIRYIFDVCSSTQILLQGLQGAGPNLTEASFVNAINRLGVVQTALYTHTTFGPGRVGAGDVAATFKFSKARWQPENNYWQAKSDWLPFTVP